MINNIIRNYLDKITLEDIKQAVKQEKNDINNDDIPIIYQYVKENKEKILKQDIFITLQEIRDISDPKTFKEIYRLYLQNENKILKWNESNKK